MSPALQKYFEMPLRFLRRRMLRRLMGVQSLAVGIVGSIIYLLIVAFNSQLNLQRGAINELNYKTETYAKSLGYFYSERLKDITNLGLQNELRTYFDNLALGMTPEYGLSASIIDIETKFNQFVSQNTIQLASDQPFKPIYRQTFFVLQDGSVLAKTNQDLELTSAQIASLTQTEPTARTARVTVQGGSGTLREFVSLPYWYKDTLKGHVFAEVSAGVFFDRFIKDSSYILSFEGTPIGLDHCHACVLAKIDETSFKTIEQLLKSKESRALTFEAPDQTRFLGVRSPIGGSPFYLVKLIPRSDVVGSVSPWVLLAGMICLLILMVVGAAANIRAYQKKALAEKLAKEKDKALNILVDNMQQSLFSITAEGKIVEPISKFSEAVFGKDIAGKQAIDVFFENKNLDSEAVGRAETVFNIVFGEDDVQWDLMSENLPIKVTRPNAQVQGGSPRTLKVRSSPIWDDAANLEKILFVVEDITEFEKLEKQVLEQRESASLFEDILKNQISELMTFMIRFEKSLASIKGFSTQSDLNEVMRVLHTLKGNARVKQLRRLSEKIHNSETSIAALIRTNSELRESPELSENDVALANEEILSIERVAAEYASIVQRLVPAGVGGEAGLNSQALVRLTDLIGQLDGALSVPLLSKIQNAVRGLSFLEVRKPLAALQGMVFEIADQLKKPVEYEVEGSAQLDADTLSEVCDCVVHLLRNCIDHGIENLEARRKAEKSIVGRIQVKCETADESVFITVQDDGAGIDPLKIASVAVARGIVSEQIVSDFTDDEKLDLIFHPGFTSKTEVTDISGRGIGLNVVKETVLKLGGSVKIRTKPGEGTSFIISIPSSFDGSQSRSA